MRRDLSNKNFDVAKRYIAKGLNSPFRSFDLVGGNPIFMKKGKGSRLIDVDGNKYIDYSLAWGPMILGHSNKTVRSTIKKVSKKGWCFGTPTEAETIFAKKITEIFPSMEKVRLTNSGTEAVMGAIRLARGYTSKEKIIVFNGNYHGHSNDTLVKKSSDEAGLLSSGIPLGILQSTLVAEYNNISSVEKLLEIHDIAAVVVEPVATNMGVVLPNEHFLNELRQLCNQKGCLLIFDEVVTGLRVSLGGAQVFYNVFPDITVLGKVLAGGMPVGAFGASKKIMDALSPDGEVYTAGTFSGNSMTSNCGITTLDLLSDAKRYNRLIKDTESFCNDIRKFIHDNKLPVVINNIGSLFSIFFTNQDRVDTYDDVGRCDFSRFKEYFQFLLERGIYISPSGEDTSFLSLAHSKRDLEYTSEVIKKFLLKLKQ